MFFSFLTLYVSRLLCPPLMMRRPAAYCTFIHTADAFPAKSPQARAAHLPYGSAAAAAGYEALQSIQTMHAMQGMQHYDDANDMTDDTEVSVGSGEEAAAPCFTMAGHGFGQCLYDSDTYVHTYLPVVSNN